MMKKFFLTSIPCLLLTLTPFTKVAGQQVEYVDNLATTMDGSVSYYYTESVTILPSSEINAENGDFFIKPVIEPVFSPTEFQATLDGQSIVLSWIDNSTNEVGFEIERATSMEENYDKIYTTEANETNYVDEEVEEGSYYYYRLRAAGEIAFSDYSAVVYLAVPFPEPEATDIDESTVHQPVYNGNISAIRWKEAGEEEQVYTYGYDGLNRLINAQYAAKSNGNYEKDNGRYSVPEVSYDLNGNIESLTRQGTNANGVSDIIDELTYSYGTGGNQLTAVGDTRGSAGFKDGNKEGDDYDYDANGNMIRDLNKGISEIQYNLLNLPKRVTFLSGDYIMYEYDATGIKLRQEVYEGGVIKKKTDYVGSFIYENDVLQLIQHDEGRIVPKYGSGGHAEPVEAYDYQYHLKDHLGNVRVTFSTTPEHYTMTETFETGEENGWQDLHRHTNTNANTTDYDQEGSLGDEVELLQSGMTGAMIFLSLNKGDTIDLSVQANYEADPTNTNWVPIAESALFSSWNAAYGGLEATEATESVFGQALTGTTMAEKDDGSTTAPMAFLNFIFFDKDMQYEAAGFKQISTAARGIGVHEPVQLDEPFIADREGYILAYLSNENQEAVNVHFDDFTVYHGKTNIVSASDYYPFGLGFNEYKRTASTPQNFKFNGIERIPELGWDLAEYRSYDPAIARWGQIDPKANEFHSPYAGFGNNPIFFADPLGDTVVVSGSEEFVAQYEHDRAHLEATGDEEVLETLEYLDNSPETVKIKEAKSILGAIKDLFVEGSGDADHATSSITKSNSVDPVDGSKGVTVKYAQVDGAQVDDVKTTSHDILIHELTHAKDIIDGTLSEARDNGQNVNVVAETNAMQTTNKVRKAEGRQIRTKYNGRKLLNDDGTKRN